jgi:hypothetical protein
MRFLLAAGAGRAEVRAAGPASSTKKSCARAHWASRQRERRGETHLSIIYDAERAVRGLDELARARCRQAEKLGLESAHLVRLGVGQRRGGAERLI